MNDTWTYRYGPSGIREQKRLMTSPAHDKLLCGVAPWVAYVLSPGGQQLAVYHGRQVTESVCTPYGFGQYERRVHIYPVEFRSYGPDGINRRHPPKGEHRMVIRKGVMTKDKRRMTMSCVAPPYMVAMDLCAILAHDLYAYRGKHCPGRKDSGCWRCCGHSY